MCGIHPYNQVILLPDTEDSLPQRVVRKYAKQQKCPPIPNLPAGTFELVTRSEDDVIFMFKFKKTQPCSDVDKLPCPVNRHINLPTPAEDLRGLASSYLYMKDQKYDILQNGEKILVSVQPGETGLVGKMETTRASNLLDALKSRVKKEEYASIKVALADKDMSCLRPFSGGGDIYLQTDHISACLSIGGGAGGAGGAEALPLF